MPQALWEHLFCVVLFWFELIFLKNYKGTIAYLCASFEFWKLLYSSLPSSNLTSVNSSTPNRSFRGRESTPGPSSGCLEGAVALQNSVSRSPAPCQEPGCWCRFPCPALPWTSTPPVWTGPTFLVLVWNVSTMNKKTDFHFPFIEHTKLDFGPTSPRSSLCWRFQIMNLCLTLCMTFSKSPNISLQPCPLLVSKRVFPKNSYCRGLWILHGERAILTARFYYLK